MRRFLFLCLVMTASLLQSVPSHAGSLKKLRLDTLHQEAPELALKGAGGSQARLRDFLGKNLIVHFWASWCDACKKELPQLERLSKSAAKENVLFLPISTDSPSREEAARSFLASVPGHLTFWIAVPGKSLEDYTAWGQPVTYFVSSSGKIVARALGMRDWDTAGPAEQLLLEIFGRESIHR